MVNSLKVILVHAMYVHAIMQYVNVQYKYKYMYNIQHTT